MVGTPDDESRFQRVFAGVWSPVACGTVEVGAEARAQFQVICLFMVKKMQAQFFAFGERFIRPARRRPGPGFQAELERDSQK